MTAARNTFASLIASAFNTAVERRRQMATPYPLTAEIERIKDKDASALLKQLDEAIRGKEQSLACALTTRYGALGHADKDLFALLQRYAISEDGSLHGEKYFYTVSDEFSRTRPAFRWRHATALARVTASAYGKPGAGVEEAQKLLKIDSV